jgi:DNA-binding winged helix-turn-helix (wHTH) protein
MKGCSMHVPQPASAPDARLLFGSCVLDRPSARLWRAGRNVPLTPKAYAVLVYLAEHAGRLVTKQELLDAAWTDVFVGDAALKVCIPEIRKALDDDAQRPQYIETAHRRGYRFIADVSVAAPQLDRRAGGRAPLSACHERLWHFACTWERGVNRQLLGRTRWQTISSERQTAYLATSIPVPLRGITSTVTPH